MTQMGVNQLEGSVVISQVHAVNRSMCAWVHSKPQIAPVGMFLVLKCRENWRMKPSLLVPHVHAHSTHTVTCVLCFLPILALGAVQVYFDKCM